MAKASTTETVAAELSVPERVPLFCLGSDTDWVKAGVPAIIVQRLLVRNLAARDHTVRSIGDLRCGRQPTKCTGHSGMLGQPS